MYPCQNKMLADLNINEDVDSQRTQYRVHCKLTDTSIVF